MSTHKKMTLAPMESREIKQAQAPEQGQKQDKEWLAILPWVLRASLFSFLSLVQLSSLYFVNKDVQKQVIRFLSSAPLLPFHLGLTRLGLCLVKKHARSLREIVVPFHTMQLAWFSPPPVLSCLRDVILSNAGTLRTVQFAVIWHPIIHTAVAVCSKLENMSFEFDGFLVWQLQFPDISLAKECAKFIKEMTLVRFPRLKRVTLPRFGFDDDSGITVLSRQFELQELHMGYTDPSEMNMLVQSHFRELETLILRLPAYSDASEQQRQRQTLDHALQFLTQL